MKKFLIVAACLVATGLTAQTTTAQPDCDELCQTQRRIEKAMEEQKAALRGLEYEKAKLTQRRYENVKIQFETDFAQFLKENAAIDYAADIDIANAKRLAAERKAAIAAKFKGKWEATIPREVLEKCADSCPPVKY